MEEETLENGAKIIKTFGPKGKKEFPAEKPWKKKRKVQQPQKPKKVYDLTRWTQEQIEVLEALDNQQALTEA